MDDQRPDDAEIRDLPIQEWEVPERRLSLPADLQRLIGCSAPVVRVRKEIDEKLRTKHPATRFIYDQLSEYLVFWEEWRAVEAKDGGPRWQIFQHIPDERRGKVYAHMTVIGIDREGSVNLISSHRRDESFLRRLRQAGELHPREVE